MEHERLKPFSAFLRIGKQFIQTHYQTVTIAGSGLFVSGNLNGWQIAARQKGDFLWSGMSVKKKSGWKI